MSELTEQMESHANEDRREIVRVILKLRRLCIQGFVWRFMERDDGPIQAEFERLVRANRWVLLTVRNWPAKVVAPAERRVERLGILAIAEAEGWL